MKINHMIYNEQLRCEDLQDSHKNNLERILSENIFSPKTPKKLGKKEKGRKKIKINRKKHTLVVLVNVDS